MPAASSVAANWRLENPGRREIGRSRTSISAATPAADSRSEEHTSELQSLAYLVCRLLLEKKKTTKLQSLANLAPSMLLDKTTRPGIDRPATTGAAAHSPRRTRSATRDATVRKPGRTPAY